jgi:hypothetical protein
MKRLFRSRTGMCSGTLAVFHLWTLSVRGDMPVNCLPTQLQSGLFFINTVG